MKPQNRIVALTLLLLWTSIHQAVSQSPTRSHSQRNVTNADFKEYFDQFDVEGSFVICGVTTSQCIVYNEAQLSESFSPASTFKIANSLIGLETGVIPDADYVIRWDSVKRRVESWNKDHSLRSAFKNSAVWYYQELAKRVGGEQMRGWLTRLNYGNKNSGGGVDRFWLNDSLQITPWQQIDFLTRLYNEKLPVSKSHQQTVKEMMLFDDTAGYKLYGKTGWGFRDKLDIGWLVGFVEKDNLAYVYVTCVQARNSDNEEFGESRRAITENILRRLSIKP